jgi:hypothetical protein
LKIACPQFRHGFVGIEISNAEIVVIEIRRSTLLLNSKKALADAEDVYGSECCFRLGAYRRTPDRTAMCAGYPERACNVIQTNRSERALRRGRLSAGNQSGERNGNLPPASTAAFKIGEYLLDKSDHGTSDLPPEMNVAPAFDDPSG